MNVFNLVSLVAKTKSLRVVDGRGKHGVIDNGEQEDIRYILIAIVSPICYPEILHTNTPRVYNSVTVFSISLSNNTPT